MPLKNPPNSISFPKTFHFRSNNAPKHSLSLIVSNSFPFIPQTQHDILDEPPQNLLNDDHQQMSTIDSRGFGFLQNTHEPNGMDTDEFGLIDEIFLVNDLSSTMQPTSLGDSPMFDTSADDGMDMMKAAIDGCKPFESFEKQITITVPQPPPLKADAISIGEGLFQGKHCRAFFGVLYEDFF